ncbi:MAG: hypothetical protein LBJ02_08225 [Bifidobacteriaceae bacterium]|nr:hypothetical protein [Bifidobacteriaceae bacterium]
MERFVRLLVTAVVGFVPAAGLLTGSLTGHTVPFLIGAVAVATALLIAGWPSLAHLPEPHSARLALAFTGAVAIILAAIKPGDGSAVLVAIALGFPAVFIRELSRPAPRPDLVRSVAGTTCGVMAVAAMGLWVSAGDMQHFVDLAILAGTGVAVSCLALGLNRLLPAHGWRVEVAAISGFALAACAGAGAAFLVSTPWWAGAAVAGACGVAPGAVWMVSESRGAASGRFRLRDAALVTLPLAVASVPVWAAALMR